MTPSQAQQIAKLINNRNQLTEDWTAERILAHEENWVFLEEDNIIAACAESRKVQWYHWEICHVSVSTDLEGKHFGSRILLLAEEKAIASGAKILQCTIRTDNKRSEGLFLSKGYKKQFLSTIPEVEMRLMCIKKALALKRLNPR